MNLLYLALFLCTIFVSSSATSSSSSFPGRSILREVHDNDQTGTTDRDYAVELNATNFDAVLKDTPATFAVVEFFANWCPACRNYKPHYEKVAKLFNGPDAVHPGIILLTRVDCASKINTKLCDKFSVGHYPMLFWGPPPKFVGGSWEPKQEKSDIHVIDDARTADRLLNWINKQMSSSFGLDDQKFQNEHLSSNVSDPEQIARAIYDVEEATSLAFDIILEHKMIKPETRASLVKFLQVLTAHHPSRRCRKGAGDLLVSFADLYPTDFWSSHKQEDDKSSVKNFQICGKEVPRGYWMFCRGSKNETRGFSCGLWVLLHSLSVRIEDGESQFMFNAICDFVHNFFVCEECRQHFYDMCSSVSTPFNKARDFVLWLWSSHNKVNERLSKEEASLGTGDPKFPKTIWPTKQLCPSCYLGHDQKSNKIEWNQDEVYKALKNYYGKTLVSLYKEKDIAGNDGTKGAALEDLIVATNAVVVPVGAYILYIPNSSLINEIFFFFRLYFIYRTRCCSSILMMLPKKLLIFATFLLTSTAAAPYHNSYYSENVAPLVSSESAQIIPDSYIIVFKKHVDEVKVKYHHSCVNDYVSEEKRDLSKRGLLDDFISGIKHTFDFDNFQGYAGKFSKEVLDKIRRSDEVAYVEKDQMVYATELQKNAPWGLARISHRSRLTFGTFNKYLFNENGGDGVTVYIIDTGVNIKHEDFGGRAVWGITVPQGDEDIDGNGHGTHVAGTVAGKSFGVSKKSKIVAIKVLRSNGSGTMSDVIKGVEYAAQFHLEEKEKARKDGRVFKGSGANMSLGGGRSRTLDDAVNGAVNVGLNFAVAAGNDNRDACDYSPAAAENAITVGASTIEDERAWFSNYGKCVDVFGPGKDIRSAWIGSPKATNTISGTSMASPHVAGLIAYLLSLEPDSSSEFYSTLLTPKELKNKILKLATKDKLTKIPSDTKNLLIYNNYD